VMSTSVIKDKLQEQHKYDDSFLQFRFSSVGDSSPPDAHCVVCYQTSENSFMFPAKLVVVAYKACKLQKRVFF
jgi:hypothetical protein